MKQIITLIFLITSAINSNAQKRDIRLVGIDTMIIRILKEWNVPGISISVVEKNKVLMAKGFGYKDYENKKPVTENTLFAIGSCTKAFTASLLSTPIDDGKLVLDNPVNDYMPELQFYNNELTRNVTVRDMLCHRTGLPRHDLAWASGISTNKNKQSNRDYLVHIIRYFEPSAALRERYQYNNYMYIALGKLTEKLIGKTWEQLIKERIFAPLNMNGSNTSTDESLKTSDFAYGYTNKNGNATRLKFVDPEGIDGGSPAGGINSNAKDLANWLLMWTNGGKFNGKEIISTSFYKQAISSQMVASNNLPLYNQQDIYFLNYGLGWFITSYRGHYGVGHGGAIDGFSTYTTFLPADSIGIFVSANQDHSPVPKIIHNLIADRLLGESHRDWNAIQKEVIAKEKAIENEEMKADNVQPKKDKKPTHDLVEYTGTYKNDGYGSFVIKSEKNELIAMFNNMQVKINHLNYNNFKFSPEGDVFDETISVNGFFTINHIGNIESLMLPLEQGVKDIEFKKEISAITVKIGDLQKYTGEYELQGAIVKIRISEKNSLIATIPGQPDYELIPIKEDEFSVKGVSDYSVKFEKDKQDKMAAFYLNQPGGTVIAKRVIN